MTKALTKQNLALATAALGVGIGYGGTASAATVSTAPVGFKPVALSEDSTTDYSFDVSGSERGTVDVSGKTPIAANSKTGIGSKPGKIKLNSSAYEFYNANGNDNLLASAQANLPEGGYFSSKSKLSDDGASNFGATPQYGFLRDAPLGSARALSPAALSDPQLYYIQGTFADRTFTLSDYGKIVPDAAVPEPATWAMLTMGIGGVGAALRRSRRAAGRRKAVAA